MKCYPRIALPSCSFEKVITDPREQPREAAQAKGSDLIIKSVVIVTRDADPIDVAGLRGPGPMERPSENPGASRRNVQVPSARRRAEEQRWRPAAFDRSPSPRDQAKRPPPVRMAALRNRHGVPPQGIIEPPHRQVLQSRHIC